jgi:hypothetical protein
MDLGRTQIKRWIVQISTWTSNKVTFNSKIRQILIIFKTNSIRTNLITIKAI